MFLCVVSSSYHITTIFHDYCLRKSAGLSFPATLHFTWSINGGKEGREVWRVCEKLFTIPYIGGKGGREVLRVSVKQENIGGGGG